MIPATENTEQRKFDHLLNSIAPGNVYFVTGKNGSGKSRFFAYATKELRQSQLHRQPKTERLLCLSGTMYDKYPSLIYKAKASDSEVVYLGNKVNNNMVSGTAPFRVLCHYMLRRLESPILRTSISLALTRLNFEPIVALRFSARGLVASRDTELLGKELVCDLIRRTNDMELVGRYIDRLASGDIRLSDMQFFRGGKPFGLSDLSSGERQYVLAILGFIYCGSERCTIFYDEPENSFHPEWQLSIVKDLVDVGEALLLNATLIIATHSPLIASSVRNGKVYICDLPAGQAWRRADLFGRASDTVLREQFHLYSARSPEVASIINKCLGLIAHNETKSEKFKDLQSELSDLNLNFTPDDPLEGIVATILGL